ncbi:hypothetical protein J437_LFUL019339 [Ladona fulva]|uniref:Uncharacterized protein n=1 Tax=Ladona fulva TaxID=123851 RepID=A0A8K0PA76_LADFU|nr:hypothetical protein J437_LFUL019339 [Ladona fulva]
MRSNHRLTVTMIGEELNLTQPFIRFCPMKWRKICGFESVKV